MQEETHECSSDASQTFATSSLLHKLPTNWQGSASAQHMASSHRQASPLGRASARPTRTCAFAFHTHMPCLSLTLRKTTKKPSCHLALSSRCLSPQRSRSSRPRTIPPPLRERYTLCWKMPSSQHSASQRTQATRWQQRIGAKRVRSSGSSASAIRANCLAGPLGQVQDKGHQRACKAKFPVIPETN